MARTKNKPPRSKSMRGYFLQRFSVVAILFLLIFTVLGSAIIRNMQQYAMRNIRIFAEITNNAVTQSLNRNISLIQESSLGSSDIWLLNSTEIESEEYYYSARVRKMLENYQTSSPIIGTNFVYLADKDIFLSSHINVANYHYELFHEEIREMFHKCSRENTLDQLNIQKWFFMSSNGQDYLVRIVKVNNDVYIGAFSGMDQLLAGYGFPVENVIMVFLSHEDNRYYGVSDILKTAEGIVTNNGNAIRYNGETYYRIAIPLSFLDGELILFVLQTEFLSSFASFHVLILLFFILLIILLFSMYRFMNSTLKLPQTILTPAIQSISEGQYDVHIESPTNFEEVKSIVEVYNTLIGEIEHLRIRVYEEELVKRDFQLKHLRTQIAPHFLVNCLNTVLMYSIEDPDSPEAADLVATLSHHLRYALTDVDEVMLSEEIGSLKNYLRLTTYRFPGCLDYEIAIEPAIYEASVFPLILISLSENSVKNGLVMGEPFTIRVSGYYYERDDEPRLHLEHFDSGPGLSAELLERFNHITEYPTPERGGHGIGIYNTAMRLRIIYGESAVLSFTNAEQGGLIVSIDMPFRKVSNNEASWYDTELKGPL